MRVIDDLAKANLKEETILTIGAFDGVHRGHQALIGTVVERARATGRLSGLITFHPHPLAIRAPERAPRYLTAPREKLPLLESLGLDLVALLSFDSTMADTPANTFMEKVARNLRPRELWIGADFHLGRHREGDPSRLQELGRELGYEVHVFQTVGGEQAVSSSRIRSLLREGCVEEATALLGRYPSLTGESLPGSPATSLDVDPGRALPADGIYAAFAVLRGDRRVPALVRIGTHSDREDARRTVDVDPLDHDQEIHGDDIKVEFVSRLGEGYRSQVAGDPSARPEIDRQAARRILGQAPEESSLQVAALEARRYCFHEQEHTADRALRVWGMELGDLFVGAALGMCTLMGDLEALAPQVWRTLRLEAEDRETLLVACLNELLFLIEQEGLLFTEFRLESLCDATGTAGASMVVKVGGAVAPVTGAHIKAATYHDLELVEDEAGWSAVITFDV